MKIALLSPQLILEKDEFLGSGVPYWPVELATFASFLRNLEEEIEVYDLFGFDPKVLEDRGSYFVQGKPTEEFLAETDLTHTDVVFLFAISFMSIRQITQAIELIKLKYPKLNIIVLENTQAVTSFSLAHVSEVIFEAGADALLCGEPYHNWEEVKAYILNIAYNEPPKNLIINGQKSRCFKRLLNHDFEYPIPAWDLFNLAGYWSLPYSHGPKTSRFFPILTSRGCPFPCDFCVVPELSGKRWSGNSPERVVKEILYLRDKFGVRDFQVEDLNPTVNYKRWDLICDLLIEYQCDIRFYFVSGTKAETVRIYQLKKFAEAGLKFLSISPESGSPEVMTKIGKKFNFAHGLALVESCRGLGIRTQACFIVGHPNETQEDIVKSKAYLRSLVSCGLDEVAVFAVSPFAGSRLFELGKVELNDKQQVTTFSPKSREDYNIVSARRRTLINAFFLAKLGKGLDIWKQGIRSLFGTPETKMENLPKRIIYIWFLVLKLRLEELRRRIRFV